MSNPWEIQTIEYDRTNSEGNADVTGYGQIAILLSKYVLKEKGKGLSSNDFTDNDVLKLNSIEVGAEVNKLETLTVNRGSKIYPTTDKNINLNIPTKVSELDNDLGYAKLENASLFPDYSDSYVGKSKISFQDEEKIAIGKNSNADDGGIAIGENTSTSETYDVNIANELKHNVETDIWEGKFEESVTALQNTNGTNLTELDTVISDLADEVQNRIDADTTLQDNIDTEVQNRIDADTTLQDNIDLEIQNRSDADDTLQGNIDTATQRIDDIEDLIPNQASTSNQLADKSFVNSSIQTTTANFRGSWDTWADVPTDPSLYPQDFAGNRTPTTNDYMVVQNASDYTYDVLSGTWRFKYSGTWNTDGKNGWLPEYQVNEEPFTSEQLYAINSGITSTKVTQYDNHISNTNNPHSVTKCQVGLGDVVNTGDSDTPTSGGLTKFTTGGAYTELAKKQDKCLSSPITINGTQECTVESALSAINDYTSCVCSDLSTHISDTSNPHSVTATQVGLGNVDNTADNTKCVKDSVCFNGLTYAEVCADIQCNMGTVTGIDVYCDSICKCTIDDATSLYLGTNAFNSTAFTTCTGTVTVCDTCDNCNLDVVLRTGTTEVGVSEDCHLKYNPSTGVLCANSFCGNFCGSISYATCACNADTVSRATFGNSDNGEHDANNITSNGLWYYHNNGPSIAQGASTDDGALYSQAYNTNWVAQIAQDYRNGRLFFRGKNNGVWQSWLTNIDSGNIGSQCVYCATYSSYANSAGNAETVDGVHASSSNYGGYAVVRDANGYIYTSHVNMDVGDENIGNYSSPVLIFSGGGEKWLRRTPVGNVSVGYASSAGSASSAGYADGAGCARCTQSLLINNATWTSSWWWSGNNGQPTWLWGSNDGSTMCVWNPSNFSVYYANSAGDSAKLGGTDASCYDKWTIGTFGCAEWGRNTVGNFYVRMKALTACCNVYKAFMCALGCASTTISTSRGFPVLGHLDTHNIATLQMSTNNSFVIYRNDGAVSCTFALGSTGNPGTSDIEFFGYWK